MRPFSFVGSGCNFNFATYERQERVFCLRFLIKDEAKFNQRLINACN